MHPIYVCLWRIRPDGIAAYRNDHYPSADHPGPMLVLRSVLITLPL